MERELQLLAREILDVDRLQLVRRALRVGRVADERNHDTCGEPAQGRDGQLTDIYLVHSHLLPGVDLQLFKASEAARSMYPPSPSGTISTTLIFEGVISVTWPSA